VKRRRRVGDSVELEVRVPAAVARYCVPRGSIAIDGVSLTIASLSSPRVVRVALVPHTLASTTLARAGGGARVHLEVDQMAKFVMQQALRYRGRGPRGR
jgi:riboflavin synthase